MITFDQILLLQEKIESAANKIKQLQAENDALRSKCAELTNALSSKSEQLSMDSYKSKPATLRAEPVTKLLDFVSTIVGL